MEYKARSGWCESVSALLTGAVERGRREREKGEGEGRETRPVRYGNSPQIEG